MRPEDVQNAQAKAIIKDALSDTLVNIPDEALNKLKDGLYRLNTAFHISAEIDKVIGNYSPSVFIFIRLNSRLWIRKFKNFQAKIFIFGKT